MKSKKKAKRHAYAHIRQTWAIHPGTRVKESKKLYSRKHKHKGADSDYGKELLCYLLCIS